MTKRNTIKTGITPNKDMILTNTDKHKELINEKQPKETRHKGKVKRHNKNVP